MWRTRDPNKWHSEKQTGIIYCVCLISDVCLVSDACLISAVCLISDVCLVSDVCLLYDACLISDVYLISYVSMADTGLWHLAYKQQHNIRFMFFSYSYVPNIKIIHNGLMKTNYDSDSAYKKMYRSPESNFKKLSRLGN